MFFSLFLCFNTMLSICQLFSFRFSSFDKGLMVRCIQRIINRRMKKEKYDSNSTTKQFYHQLILYFYNLLRGYFQIMMFVS